MGGIVLSILAWQEGGESVGILMAIGAAAMFAFAWWLLRRKKQDKPTLIDPDLFRSKYFRLGISQQMLQNITLGGLMIALPIYFQMVFEYTAMQTGLAIAPFSLSMFAIALLAGRRAGNRRPSRLIQVGFGITLVGLLLLIPIIPRADSGLSFVIPLLAAGAGLGLLVSQLNNYTLSPISEERVSEAAGVNSASGSFGLSFGLAFAGAIMLAALSLSFTNMAQSSTVLSADEQAQLSQALEEDAQVMSDTQLQAQLAGQPADVQAEIISINTDARHLALQVAVMVPVLAALLGLINSFRMVRMPEPEAKSSAEGMVLG
jgi:LPXTG-motif cell wall-anchored protein